MVDVDNIWLLWFKSVNVIHDVLALIRVVDQMSECIFHSAPILIDIVWERLVEIDTHYGQHCWRWFWMGGKEVRGRGCCVLAVCHAMLILHVFLHNGVAWLWTVAF